MLKVNDIVKLNPEIFPEDKRKIQHFSAGRLNYPALALNWELEVLEVHYNEYLKTNLVKLKILNDERIKNGVTVDFILEDCIVVKE